MSLELFTISKVLDDYSTCCRLIVKATGEARLYNERVAHSACLKEKGAKSC